MLHLSCHPQGLICGRAAGLIKIILQAIKYRDSLAPVHDGRCREKDVVVPVHAPFDMGTQESGQGGMDDAEDGSDPEIPSVVVRTDGREAGCVPSSSAALFSPFRVRTSLPSQSVEVVDRQTGILGCLEAPTRNWETPFYIYYYICT